MAWGCVALGSVAAGPVRLRTPGSRVVKICVPVLLDDGVGFYCLGKLSSLLVSSPLSSLRGVLGKWLALRYLEGVRARLDEGGLRPGFLLRCGDIESVDLVRHRLLGLEVLELRITDSRGGVYSVGQADTPRELREVVHSIWRHLEERCGSGGS